MEEAQRAANSKRNEANTQDRLAAGLQQKIDLLVDDPRLRRELIELPIAEINKRIEGFRQELLEVNSAKDTANRDLGERSKAVEQVEQRVGTIQAELSQLQKRADALDANCGAVIARFSEEGLAKDITEGSLRNHIARLESQREHLVKLRDEVTEAELAVDEAATRAAFTGLHKRVAGQEEALEDARDSRRGFRAWREYFETASVVLSKNQRMAVSHFTENYGPRASVIQRRLRSVPGFEDIEVTSEESTIQVRARRQEHELRPIDYFSQSQQQTLLLGLFLSACLSQSWSSFSPILLDDPVTHCDDLNAYAFLDLLAGLTESELTGRQVVISTCDDRFLHLARRKFRHLGSKAKYYTFTAIGKDGPVVLALD